MSPRKPSTTIFIAEDNPVLLQGLERALSAHGYAVSSAADGEALLGLLEGAEPLPDLLLVDVMMPGLSGFDVLRMLRAEPRWAGIPVVLITAASDEMLPTHAREGGAADVLIKPFRLGELMECIEEHVRAEGDTPGRHVEGPVVV